MDDNNIRPGHGLYCSKANVIYIYMIYKIKVKEKYKPLTCKHIVVNHNRAYPENTNFETH